MERSMTASAAPKSSHRARLLVGSALCGVAALLAQPAMAQTLPAIPGAGAITVSGGGSQPVITAPNANTLDVDLNAPRTVINWASLHVSGGDTMDFHFDANSDIVLNKTTTAIAVDAGGTVTGKVGAATGGNIWFYSPQGVFISPGANMTAGGFLFSRGTGLSDAAFVGAADPLANLRAAADSLVRISTISSATSVAISAGGDVVLSAATGDLNANIVAAADSATVTATTGSVSIDEVTATGGDVTVTANGGGADVASASAGDDITVIGTSGDAILHAAALTGSGAGHDLSISATGGAAVLGEIDYQDITAANVFSRAGGNGGTASVTSSGGDALVHLDASAGLTTVRGEGVDITIQTGPLTVETLTALTNDAYGETYDGAITVGAATADGSLGLYAAGGDLTVTGSAHGGAPTHLETDGLLDVSGATLISSDGDLELLGDAVIAGEVSAVDSVTVASVHGDALVQKAVAGSTVQVGSLYGSATLRAAEGPDGIAVFADQTATFGADTQAGITAAHYAVTDAACGCGPGAGGLQVLSSSGDAVVNIHATNNPIALVAAAIDGDATVVLMTGDLSIDELAAFNISLEAMDGTVETGFATSSGGDYWVKGHDFLGDVLTPTLFSGAIRDVTIIDTLGDLALTGDLYAGRKLTIAAEDGAVTGDAALLAGTGAGDGDISVTASAIALDTVEGDGDITLDAGGGQVAVGARVTVGKTYRLTGGAFSTAALSPLGAQTGFWAITDNAGDFDHAGVDLAYVGGISIRAATGALKVGDITSATGDLYLEGDSGVIGALRAENGVIDARGYVGGLAVASATALDDIDLYGQTGVTLGALDLKGLGTNTFEIHAGGDIVLGAATPGAITTANAATSAGAFSGSVMETTLGAIHINLDHATTQFSNVTALGAVAIDVRHGALSVVSAVSFGAGVGIDGPDGALTVQTVGAHGGDAHVSAGDDVALRGAAVDGDLVVTSTTGGVTLENLVRADALSLRAAQGVSQAAGAVIDAPLLTITAGSGASLLGANKVAALGAVNVAAGGLAFNAAGALNLTGPIDAAGQAVDLRAGGAIGQSGGQITAGTLTGQSVGGASFGRDNQVAQLGAFTNTGGVLLFNDAGALTLTGAVLSTGTLVIRSHGGLTLAATGGARADGAGDAAVLASDGVFTNASGADGVVASNPAGRWLVYSQAAGDPAGSTAGDSFGGLAGKSFYGAAYDFATGAFGSAPNAGNRFVHAYQPTLTATPVSRTVTYDGTIPTVSATLSGLVNGDSAADAWSGQAAVAGATRKAVGAYGLTASIGSLASDLNYAFAFGTGLLTIDPKAITGHLLAGDKTYDGTTTAAGTVVLTGVVLGDTVGASGAYAFADKTAGLGKTVTASGVGLGGADAGNYVLSSVAADSADIGRKTITGAVVAAGKTYDGATAASGSTSLAGVVAGDDLSVTGAYAFADKNAGAGKVVTVTGAALVGGDASNYDLASVATGSADIARKAITGSVTANNKTYDGTTAATGAVGLSGVVAGDDLSAAGASFAFADKNAGTGKTVTATGTVLAGGDASNYDLVSMAAGSADIGRKALTGAVSADSKTYDGTTAATGAIGLAGVVAGDQVSATATFAFDDKNAGSGKTVTVSAAALAGADQANYDLGGVGGAVADILRRAVTVAADAGGKPFGQRDPALTYHLAAGQLVQGEGFTGHVARQAGEAPGPYAIGRGTLALSANYDVTLTGTVFTIRPTPATGQDSGPALRALAEAIGFDLDWTPDPDLTATGALGCLATGDCPQADASAAPPRAP